MKKGLTLMALALIGVLAYFAPQGWRLWNFVQGLNDEAIVAQTYGVRTHEIAQTCALCHGLEGVNRSDFYPHLAGQPVAYLKGQLDNFANGTRQNPHMTPLAISLSSEDRQAIADYYASFMPAPTKADETGVDLSIIATGEALAESCRGCHGPKLEGGTMPGSNIPVPRLAGQAHKYLSNQLANFRHGLRPDPSGAMKAIANGLNEGDASAVVSYLATR